MELNPQDRALIAALADGLPLVQRPYDALADRLGISPEQVVSGLSRLTGDGTIRRLGVVVRHHELGYRANAMVVWAIPEAEVADIGRRLGACAEVTLCYRRPSRPPGWPYTLFTMVHGRDRPGVTAAVAAMAEREGVAHYRHELLFSLRRFKQCGARYGLRQAAE
jgi:Transcriptional regulators